ncbi:MAG: DNA polymerase III subunit delta [Acidiferrobacterales bacterium]
MRINAKQLTAHLKAKLAPLYLVCGDEPLLVDECCAAVVAIARERGFSERSVLTVESGFDWGELYTSTLSLSLFSSKRLIELRMPAGRPGDAGTDVLQRIAQQPAQDSLLLVKAGKLDKRALATRWVKALEKAGVVVTVYPLEARELPGWVAGRMRAHGLTPAAEVPEALAYHYQGNLLGVAQEIHKLAMLQAPGSISLDDICDNLSDNARFNVFTLVDTALGGDHVSAARILASLRSEGTDAILILRILARETRMLAQIAARLAQGEHEAGVFGAHHVWPRRQPLIRRATKRSNADWWLALLRHAARADRILKGRLGGDIWQELQCLVLAMSGCKLATCRTIDEYRTKRRAE